MAPHHNTVSDTGPKSTEATARMPYLDRQKKATIVSLCVRPSWPARALTPTDEVPPNIILLAQAQQCDGPLLIVWSAQRTANRKSWPTNFPDDSIVWFQGQDRQMIPFDRITGALRLEVELFAKSENAALSGPRNTSQDDGVYRIDMRKFLSWPLIAVRSGNQVPGCLLSRITKDHSRIVFHWSKSKDNRLPTVFNQNIAWYEASNKEWIAFDRTTGEVRSDIQPFPELQTGVIKTVPPPYQAPPPAAIPNVYWSGWRADIEPFRSFLAMNLEPVDADPDIFWMRIGMYFRPCRISTGCEDNLAMPNLIVVREGQPGISIHEYMRTFQRPSPLSDGPREDGDVRAHYGSVPRMSHSGPTAQDQNISGTVHYPEAPPGGFGQPVSGAAGVLSSSGNTMNMEYVPAAQPSAGVRRHSEAFDPLDREPLPVSSQPASKKPRTLFAGVRYQDRPSAGTSPFVAPPPRVFPPPNHAISRPTLSKSRDMPPPPTPSRQSFTHPLPHVASPSRTMAINPPTSLVRGPKGIRAVMPDEASRRQSLRDFDINAARMCFARLAASQRKEYEKREALERCRGSGFGDD
ncbi:MAG: hypothetical protein L6R42_002211 [Xanthoria sp. 1 TBL-2021]|nr:MAG: hypothetical protein L6R42_002211 [Xanthoria sp. 1 TBL-2021]